MKNLRTYENFNIKEEAPVGSSSLLDEVEKNIRNFRPGGGGEEGEIRRDDNQVSKDYRYLGNWIDDEQDRYDDDFDESDFEDNDQRIWAPGEGKKYFEIFKKWAQSYSWFDKVKLGLETSEKDWCEFTVKIL